MEIDASIYLWQVYCTKLYTKCTINIQVQRQQQIIVILLYIVIMFTFMV